MTSHAHLPQLRRRASDPRAGYCAWGSLEKIRAVHSCRPERQCAWAIKMAAMQTEAEQLWPIPDDLSEQGRQAANVILEFLTENDLTYHGGGGRFYSPQQWRERREAYGLESLLVVTHDGGDHARAMNFDYELREALQNKLAEHGMFMEGCTCWYSAVYRI